jgi:phosphomannomutase
MNKRVFYFDMDGTLTNHRQQIEPTMIKKLRELMKYGIISVITGSKISDIKYQLNLASLKKKLTERELNKLVLMPCNGTKIYQWSLGLNGWGMTDGVTMKKNSHIDLQKLYRTIIKCQQILLDKENYMGDFDIQPDFIDYRESLVNWSPIGRSSSLSQRQLFINLDSRVGLRDYAINLLQSMLLSDKTMSTQLEIAKGGQTSMDIYPKGWDKTFGLWHFKDHNHWFIGDACEAGQNDHQIYLTVKHSYDRLQAFKTKSPSNTHKIIDSILDTLKEEN